MKSMRIIVFTFYIISLAITTWAVAEDLRKETEAKQTSKERNQANYSKTINSFDTVLTCGTTFKYIGILNNNIYVYSSFNHPYATGDEFSDLFDNLMGALSQGFGAISRKNPTAADLKLTSVEDAIKNNEVLVGTSRLAPITTKYDQVNKSFTWKKDVFDKQTNSLIAKNTYQLYLDEKVLYRKIEKSGRNTKVDQTTCAVTDEIYTVKEECRGKNTDIDVFLKMRCSK